MNKINKYFIYGIIFTLIAGTILHFVYQWSGNNSIVGLFSPVNESVWEHLKLLYYPMSIWIFVGYFKYAKGNPNFFLSALVGLIFGLITIPLLFYILQGLLGKSMLLIDLAIYIVGVALSFLTMRFIFVNYNLRIISVKAGIILWELFFVLFALFTVFPPTLPIFLSP